MFWNGQWLENIGDLGSALCQLEDEWQAADFWHAYVEEVASEGAEKPESVARSNVGYLMGYYSDEERKRVYHLLREFNVYHPIFGDDIPTPEEAFEAGMVWAAGWTRPS